MNLATLANVADLLAAVGVICSLIFVAVQIRQNTRTVANTHWESYLDRLAASFARNTDQRIAEIVNKGGKSFSSLTGTEKIVYSAWADEYILCASLLLVYREQSVLGTATTDTAYRRLKWFFDVPGNIEWWNNDRRHPVPSVVEDRINQWLRQSERG